MRRNSRKIDFIKKNVKKNYNVDFVTMDENFSEDSNSQTIIL